MPMGEPAPLARRIGRAGSRVPTKGAGRGRRSTRPHRSSDGVRTTANRIGRGPSMAYGARRKARPAATPSFPPSAGMRHTPAAETSGRGDAIVAKRRPKPEKIALECRSTAAGMSHVHRDWLTPPYHSTLQNLAEWDDAQTDLIHPIQVSPIDLIACA
ncbi:hypothetical protein GQ53DRAFT_308979 [Thozetella sp. PMI_491]|nr:hypothetical protein GQ53DRAFT_308979 [Thozetella sp. PMI_491]